MVSGRDVSSYRNRHGIISQNVLAACNFDLEFMYVLSGWEGSAHDSKILNDALSRRNGLKVPQGIYIFIYLCSYFLLLLVLFSFLFFIFVFLYFHVFLFFLFFLIIYLMYCLLIVQVLYGQVNFFWSIVDFQIDVSF